LSGFVHATDDARGRGAHHRRSACGLGEKTMRSLTRCLFLLTIALACATSPAKTLRWATRGDAASMDPYAFNEGVTFNINALVHDRLVERDREQRIVPSLATGWSVVDDTTWRFTIRRDAKFHDGSPVTIDDVVFSIERSQQPTSEVSVFTRRLGRPVAIDAETLELRLDAPNPVLLEQAQTVMVMSRAWCKVHGVERVPVFAAREEAYSTRNAMGSGPFMLEKREPGVRTVLKKNPHWWGRFDGNVTEIVHTPIGNDATRTAALIAGDVNFIQEAPPQDIARLEKEPAVRLTTGPENRVIFFGFDHQRDELLYGSVKGSNPFKDRRVREAFFRAIDVDSLRKHIMRGQSVPTACMTTAAIGCLAAALETHPPADVERARALMAEAGYARGFAVTLDCPNDRYINDQAICLALVPMLAKIGVTLKVDARPKSLYFPKIERHDTSFYMMGWGGGTTDAQLVLDPVLHSFDEKTQKGSGNDGRVADAELDRLIDAAAVEMNADQRAKVIAGALERAYAQFHYLPIHRQMLTWASRTDVHPVIAPSNQVNVRWIEID
jgi:peptide/nickel transport system substrate-binding protein